MDHRNDEHAATPKTVVGAVVNAVSILRYLGASSEPRGVTIIAQALGINPSTCFNILRTLTAEDLVEFDQRQKRYSLGLGAYDLARQALAKSEPYAVARPRLVEMVEHYELTGAIWRRTQDERLALVGFVESDAATRIHLKSGQRLPKLSGAAGRCLAAAQEMSRDEIARELAAVRTQGKLSLDAFVADVEEARRRGWAIDINMFVHGVTTIAAPVLDETGDFRFAVTMTMFTGRHDEATIEAIGRETSDLAHYVSNRVYGARRRTS